MSGHFDNLETRSVDERAAAVGRALPALMTLAMDRAPGMAAHLAGVDAAAVKDPTALAALPVLRKSALGAAQAADRPLGGFAVRPASGFAHVFQSPGPIYEPGSRARDWWRLGRFAHACGIGPGDIVPTTRTRPPD